jgi:hypothetical protein
VNSVITLCVSQRCFSKKTQYHRLRCIKFNCSSESLLEFKLGMKHSNWLGMCTVICLYLAGALIVAPLISGVDTGRSAAHS